MIKVVVGIVLIAWTTQGSPMAFFGKMTDVYLFSTMSGVLMSNGKPISNVRMTLEVSTGEGDPHVSEVTTEAGGQFYFSELKEKLKISPLNELVISQKIHVYHEGEKHLIWLKSKRVPDKYGELDGKPINFRCDISEDPVRVDQGRGILQTSCQWDSIEEQGG